VSATAEIALAEALRVILGATPRVFAVEGLSAAQLLAGLNDLPPQPGQRVGVFVSVPSMKSSDAVVEHLIDQLAQSALALWPVWFSDMQIGDCGARDGLTRQSAILRARSSASAVAGGIADWAEQAAALALEGRPPRVPGVVQALEMQQLCLAIHRYGVVFFVEGTVAAPQALVPGLEWTARWANAPVAVLFDKLPELAPPFDRILYEALRVAPAEFAVGIGLLPEWPEAGTPWIAPIAGRPHPLSDVEKRMADALARDDELRSLFICNAFVETTRGSRPKVDLLWREGHIVVELDGFADHGRLSAFLADRHRDYELMLSGYTVLRLANEEVARDLERAVEKIRDLVRMRREQL
jgi:very-short-patch-repair endonuclease